MTIGDLQSLTPNRGTLVMNWQLFDAFGILLGFTANLIVSRIGPLSWRFQMASASLPALCLLTLVWVIPESPRWLLKQGRLPEAFAALSALRETPLQAAVELFYANTQIQAEVNFFPQKSSDTEVERQTAIATHEVSQQGTSKQEETGEAGRTAAEEHSRHPLREFLARAWYRRTTRIDDTELDQFQRRVRATSYWMRIWQLFRDKRTRRATVAALVVMISQQLCGVYVRSCVSLLQTHNTRILSFGCHIARLTRR